MSEIEPIEGRVCGFLMREVDMLCEYVPTVHMPSIACVSCAEESYREMGTVAEGSYGEMSHAGLVCV